MSGLIQSFITCVIRTDNALLNGSTSYGTNKAHLLGTQVIMLMFTDEHYVMQHAQLM
jgi:hypothetical protein